MQNYSLFDIIGPRMVGPSSSHTAGAAKLGHMARKIARGDVKEAELTLYGSFATTGRGHGTDKALVAGVLGLHAHTRAWRNLATTALIAAGVILVVLAAFLIVIFWGLNSI